jgi:adhesin transport system outer membrane protein
MSARHGLPAHPAAALLAVLALGLPLPAGEPLTLAQALRLAAQGSVQAEVAGLATAAARQDSEQVRARYRPELNLSGGHLNLSERPTLLSPPSALGPITLPSLATPLADPSAWSYKVSASYLVYDWGRRGQALKATEARTEAVALGGAERVRRTQVEIAARYAALLELEARMKVVAQRRTALESHLRVVQDLTDHGVVARNDLLRTGVVLRTVQDAAQGLERAYASALEQLNIALGADPASPRELPREPAAPPALPWDEAACRDRAVQANEGVRALRAKLAASREQVALRRKDYAPALVTEVAHTYGQNSHLQSDHENSLYVGLTWNLFDGGVRSARLSQARSESSQAERELLEAERQAGAAAAAAWKEVQQTRLEAATAAANVQASLENLRIVGDQYREGMVRNTDVLDAESVLAESRFSVAEKHARLYAQEAVLLAAMGEDLPGFFDRPAPLEPPEQ